MGVFTKSLLVLLIAVSTPLLYRQLANEDTIKFMSSYYSNYKSVDRFLKQTANHIDMASKKVQLGATNLAVNLQNQIKAYSETKKSDPVKKSDEKPVESKQTAAHKNEKVEQYRMSDCHGEKHPVRLWTSNELARYDGKSGESEIYIGFLGQVYNVTSSAKHYGPESEYSMFAGRDATKAFVTGNFTHDLTDDIRGIEDSMYNHIQAWSSFYSSSYPSIGRIIGSFFDDRGCGTQELFRVYQVFQELEKIRASQEEQDHNLPECNSEWNGDLKEGRVWCSKKSGGVEREWVGVPRIHSGGENRSQRCVCLNLDSPDAKELGQSLHMYPNCDSSASECQIKK